MKRRSVPLILPIILRLVILDTSVSPILLGKVPAFSNLMVICFVVKSPSAAWIAKQPNIMNTAVTNRPFNVNVLIILFFLLLHKSDI